MSETKSIAGIAPAVPRQLLQDGQFVIMRKNKVGVPVPLFCKIVPAATWKSRQGAVFKAIRQGHIRAQKFTRSFQGSLVQSAQQLAAVRQNTAELLETISNIDATNVVIHGEHDEAMETCAMEVRAALSVLSRSAVVEGNQVLHATGLKHKLPDGRFQWVTAWQPDYFSSINPEELELHIESPAPQNLQRSRSSDPKARLCATRRSR